MLKNIISGNEFDNLPVEEQMKYLLCPKCDMFYLKEDKTFHLGVCKGETKNG